MKTADQERWMKLVAESSTRHLIPREISELTTLERDHHAFTLMCTRTAPLNPIAFGFQWGEQLVHPAQPEMKIHLRESGLVELGGEKILLMEATKRVAAAAKRGIAIADWYGESGRLGDKAGLEHPPRQQQAPTTSEPEQQAPIEDAAEARPRKSRKSNSAPAAIGDLFG